MKILCLGNADNIGVRTYAWLKEFNYDVYLYRILADESSLRGNPYFYLDKSEIENNSRINLLGTSYLRGRFISIFGNVSQIEKINNNFDVVIITGGIHALFFSRKIKIPKIFIHSGYEIHYYAALKLRGIPKLHSFFRNPKKVLHDYLYSYITAKSMYAVDKILDWFPPTVEINKALGFEEKIIYMSFAEDILKNRSLINKELLITLNENTKDAKKIFLWFSRLNFTNHSQAIYKGADLFIRALESYSNKIASGEIAVYIGKHGNELENFIELASKSPIYNYIKWVDHLDYPDLLAYLSINNAVLFTDFGYVNSGISGIGRDGYSVGVPMVNSTTDETMKKQYLIPGVRYYAKEISEIINSMSYFLNMSDKNFESLRKETALYGEQYIDKSFFVKRIMEEINLLVASYRDKKTLHNL